MSTIAIVGLALLAIGSTLAIGGAIYFARIEGRIEQENRRRG